MVVSVRSIAGIIMWFCALYHAGHAQGDPMAADGASAAAEAPLNWGPEGEEGPLLAIGAHPRCFHGAVNSMSYTLQLSLLAVPDMQPPVLGASA